MTAFDRKLFRFPIVFAVLLLAGIATPGRAVALPRPS